MMAPLCCYSVSISGLPAQIGMGASCGRKALTIWACAAPDIFHAACLREELLDVLL